MAYNFTAASSQSLSILDTNTLDITGAISCSCWVRRGSTITVAPTLIGKYSGPADRGYLLTLRASTGAVNFAISPDGGPSNVRSVWSNAATAADTWAHCCGTFIPSVSVNVYINGVLDNANNNTGPIPSAIYSNAANLLLGSNLNGDLAEVGIWNAALTAAEIASLAKGMTCDKVRPQSLVFYAPLIRNLQDVRGGLTITNNNTATVANHPRVYA
jgi:hypothetical protein